MSLLPNIAVSLVAALHTYILILECFLWATPRGRKIFGTTAAFAQQSRVLAANQGLYNGFLAAGLIWGVLHPDQGFGRQIELFFLGCVVVAGVVGAVTTGKGRLAVVQSLPGVVAVGFVLFG